jgi:type IV pilus assembly protein PilQ
MLNRLRIDSDMDNRMLPGISRRLGTLTAIIACLAGTTVGWAQDAGLSDLMEEMFDEFADVPDQNPDGEPVADKANDEPVDLSYLEDKVRVNEYDIVDLHVNNEDLGNVLQLLSLQSQRNIVASNNVTATVTADLYNVTFEEAMDAILHVNGFGYINKGNFIYVYTAEELTEIEQASRILVSRTITLDYLNAADAATFVQPLLSADGKITATNQAGPYAIGAGTPVGGEDYASNAMLVVFDYDENIDQIIALIDQLDIKPVQVLVEATILQTSLNEANAFGVDFSILNNMDFVDFVGSGPLGVVDDLISGIGATMAGGSTTATTVPIRGNGAAINTSVGKTSDAAGIKAGIINEDVAVFLRLLDEVTDVTVISNPKLLTLNRQPARVLVGTKVGYLQTTSTQTSSTQSVQFLDTGTQLNVRPFVSADGMIRMELMPQVSSFRLRNITDATGATVTIPDEDTSELVTNVMVRDGQTVVLGGLFTETTSASRRQVPGIGDIPLIGAAFRGHDDTTRRSEIIFMITPSIVNDIMLTEGGNRASDYMDYTRAGARQGLLPWSRERRISRLLQEAEDAVRAGDRELAISKTRWALDLHPQNASARRVLDQLSETEASISGSMLDDILQHELDLPQPSSSVPSLDAEFLSHSMSMSIDQEVDNTEVTDWLLSEGTAEPYSSQNQPLDNSASSSEDIAINPYSQPADTAVSDSFASFEGSQGFYQLTEQELVLRQSSPVVFAPEAVWLPDQAMWEPQPGDFIADENGTLVEFNPYENPSEEIAPVEETPIEEEVANVDDDSLSMNDSDEPQDFSTGWGEDEFTAAFGADAEQQPWFFPIHGGLVWIPIPRGFFPADQADSLFGGADEVISTVPTEDGGLAD